MAKAPTPEEAALEALADVLAPKIWARLKVLAAAERPGEGDGDTIAYLAFLGIVPKS